MDSKTFKSLCRHFLSTSNRIHDGWQVVQLTSDSNEGMYMKKRISRVLHKDSTSEAELDESEPLDGPDDLCYDDPSVRDTDILPELVTWEYHILFSDSYSAPVLYFNCWKNVSVHQQCEVHAVSYKWIYEWVAEN